MRRRLTLAAVVAAVAIAGPVPAAGAATVARDLRITLSDGVSLQVTVSGENPLSRRPVIVEFSPYGSNSASFKPGAGYNSVLVQIRGTGSSDGRFDALGPRTQADVAEVLAWACRQPWSDGRLGLNGFSASAITIYNSLHLRLPCVRTAVLKSGTFELYRDLLYPGGISNIVPGAGVLALIGAPALAQGLERLGRNPLSAVDVLRGLVETGLGDLRRPTLDAWWRARGFRGDVNHLPILMIDGFFDVESRGAFQAFQRLRHDGARLVVVGAHDGSPRGTDGGAGATRAWFDRYLAGARRPRRVAARRRVDLYLSDGDREDYLAGRFVRYRGSRWPIPGTRWEPLALDAVRSGSARSLNDGSLSLRRPRSATTQSYPSIPSLPTNTDPPNTAIIGGFGINAFATAFPLATDMTLAEPLGLSYTTRPLKRDVLSAGPASLELRLSSTAPETAIWAVLSDVSPDGTAHPLTAGRLLSSFPGVDSRRSLKDPRTGAVVQPYGVYSAKRPAAIGRSRLYRVELWPVGNRFRAGRRIRLDLVGASAASLPALPAVNSIRVGGREGSRLLFPVLPGSSLRRALR